MLILNKIPSNECKPFSIAVLYTLTKLSPAFMSAPLSKRTLIISALLFIAAVCNAVHPSGCLIFTSIPSFRA